MKKQLYIVLALIIIALAIIFALHHKAPVQPEPASSVSTSSPVSVSAAPTAPSDQDIKDQAWKAFQGYLTAAKNHDLATVTKLSSQLSATCKDPAQQVACFERMDAAYDAGKNLTEEKYFTHVAYDSKQIILSSDWEQGTNPSLTIVARSLIYFTRTSTGAPQLLSFNLSDSTYVVSKDSSGKTLTQDQINQAIALQTKDTDGDTLLDQVETCTEPGAAASCVKTNPDKKDSDGDGWWDSIQIFFY